MRYTPHLRYATQLAFQRGILKENPCEDCKLEGIEEARETVAHHDDYNYPLSVRWLCLSHHGLWHSSNKAIPMSDELLLLNGKELYDLGISHLGNIEPVKPEPIDRSKITFNNDAFIMALDIKRKAADLDWAGVANESGVSASTICRIRAGKNPDANSLAKLVNWCGVDFSHLIAG